MLKWIGLSMAAPVTSFVDACGGVDNPPSTIADVTATDSRFGTLNQALVNTGLLATLLQSSTFTVFAPTDDAFHALAADITTGQAVTTLQGGTFTIGSDLAITDSRTRRAGIAGTDVLTSNGVIHVIDRVILPAP
jgi:uncharacterized surface protein with fasciclin (FAS1) repeats